MNDFEYQELERKGLREAFNLKENEVFEARHNLLGLFGVLYKIDQRLKREELEREKQKKEAGKND